VASGSTASVTCTGQPVACTIQINWNENIMASTNANAQNVQAQTTQGLSYSLLVEPGS
jgi:hypothetical protein